MAVAVVDISANSMHLHNNANNMVFTEVIKHDILHRDNMSEDKKKQFVKCQLLNGENKQDFWLPINKANLKLLFFTSTVKKSVKPQRRK